jgi:predicted GH43/DUF377 family glycosyl hydrolase
MKSINVKRSKITLLPDRRRVLIRPFKVASQERAVKICARVLVLPEAEAARLLAEVLAEFDDRHHKIRDFLQRRFEEARQWLPTDRKLTQEQELLIGAYFSHEYSFEAAALFNPSIVPHPDQSDLPPGALRMVMSLRATGEGHISSITFRTGVVDAQGGIKINEPTRHNLEPGQAPNASYEKPLFERKLRELGLTGDFGRQALQDLGERFTLAELRRNVKQAAKQLKPGDLAGNDEIDKILMLAESNYEVQFDADSRLSERVLFPATPSQSNGIEDARFVAFRNEDGSTMYYATYTAYDGRMILPQFIETPDFLHFRFVTLNGPAVQNKGMALFPRKVNGKYAMLGRQDYENLYLMYSDHLHFWHTTQLLLKPAFPWEYIQMGNCGSPIETEAGWLVISHGVGPMRKYCIGAFLLDRDDPGKVIGRLREPLIKPDAEEREGYVPNVVYSCGSLVHAGRLVIPFAMSDYATTFATVPVAEVLAAME